MDYERLVDRSYENEILQGMTQQYKAIIFDLGKVVFDVSFDRVFGQWALASGQTSEEIKSKFRFDDVFEKFERGEMSDEDFRITISERLGMQLPAEVFDKGWCNLYLPVYDGIEELLRDLKQKYRIVALTNTNTIHARVWKEKYAGVLQHFERTFSSPEMATRKPESASYQMVLDYLEIKPGEAVFLDDNADNIAGAEQMGISVILVTSFGQMRDELLRRLE